MTVILRRHAMCQVVRWSSSNVKVDF